MSSDFIGNDRAKSARVRFPFRARTFCAQNSACFVSPPNACTAAAIIAISTCAPGDRRRPIRPPRGLDVLPYADVRECTSGHIA